MAYVLFAFLLFCASVMTHIIFCRSKPKSGLHVKAFILIAILFLVVYAVGVWAVQQAGTLQAQPVWGLPFQFSAGLIFVLLVPVYLILYVPTQLMSPSKKILLTVASRGNLSFGDIVLCVQEEDFINTRLRDLVSTGCVQKAEGRYLLNESGKKIAAFLNIMQFILGRNIGG